MGAAGVLLTYSFISGLMNELNRHFGRIILVQIILVTEELLLMIYKVIFVSRNMGEDAGSTIGTWAALIHSLAISSYLANLCDFGTTLTDSVVAIVLKGVETGP